MSGYIDRVIVSGDRAEDMAVRIKYAGVAGDHISTERDYERLVQWISQQDKPVFIMPTYTAMLELREAVIRRCGGDGILGLRRRKHGTEDLSFVS